MTTKHTSALARLPLPGLAAAMLLASDLSLAQQAPAQAAQATAGEVEEIVVTATKQKEPLSKVPISIVAFTSKALEESGIKSIGDLANATPGVQFDSSAGFGPGTTTNIAIRGINSGVGTSTTGVYVDDTPIQARIGALSYWGNPYPLLFDVDRVEVARGPQGTLFGAGAEGGTLRFISPEASLTDYSGTVHLEGGKTAGGGANYEAGVAYGGPIVEDKLGFRASVWTRRDGGYIDWVNPFTGATLKANSNSTDSQAGRLAFTFAPNSSLQVTPSVYAQKVTNHDSLAWYVDLSDPASGNFRNGRLAQQPNSEKWILPSLKIVGNFANGLVLTSVSSYFSRDGWLTDDSTGYTGVFFGGYGDPRGLSYPTSYDQAGPEYLTTHRTSFSQELRLSNDAAARLRWTAGLFFLRASQGDGQNVTAPWVNVNVFGLPADTPLFTTNVEFVDRNYAAFGQVDYKVVPKLTLTAGLRYGHDSARFTQSQSGLISSTGSPDPAVVSTVAGSQSQSPWSGKVGLSYQASDDAMLYSSVSHGYRVGGANQPIPTQLCGPSPDTYKPDTVDSYEVGIKGKVPDGRFRYEADSYFVNWKDIQQVIALSGCPFNYIANAGVAHSSGFDLSLRLDVAKDFTLSTLVSYNRTVYAETVYLPGSTTTVLVNSGDKVNGFNTGSPWSLNASAEYRFKLAGKPGSIRFEDTYRSKNSGPFSFQDPASVSYSPVAQITPRTNLLNVRASLTSGPLELALFCNNLLDTHPMLGRYVDIASPTLNGGLFTAYTLRPRTYGLSLDYKL